MGSGKFVVVFRLFADRETPQFGTLNSELLQKTKNSLKSRCSTILMGTARIVSTPRYYMFVSKIALFIALEAVIFLIIGSTAFALLFFSQKKKNAALQSIASSVNQPITAPAQQPVQKKVSYQTQIEESLNQLSNSLPGLMPCSDPHTFASASDQEQAKMIRYLVLDYEKQIIDNIEVEDELAAPFVASVNQLFPNAPTGAAIDEVDETADKSESNANAEIEQLSKQNKMNQGVIDQFARESREMLNCINTLESENQDLRKLIEVKAGRQ